MKSFVGALAGAFALAFPSVVAAQAQSALEKDAIAFGTRATVFDSDISPDGTKALFVGAGPGRSSVVYVADIATGMTKPIASSTGNPESFDWCSFASDARIVCNIPR